MNKNEVPVDPIQILKRSRISKIKSNSLMTMAKSPMERYLRSGSISGGSTGANSQNRNKV